MATTKLENRFVNRPLRRLWLALVSFVALPLNAADTVKVTPFTGTEIPRLNLTIPGAQLTPVGLNALPAPLAQLDLAVVPTIPTIPTIPQLAQAPVLSPAAQVAQAVQSPQATIAALSEHAETIQRISQHDSSGVGAAAEFGNFYSGSRGGSSRGSGRAAESTTLRPNGDGVYVMGRADAYDVEAQRIVEKYKGKIDFSEATDVMDDAYAEAYARAKIVEHASKGGAADDHSAHLPMTLTWVDAVVDDGGKKTAVHTSRVFFHHAKNPQSEINEGIRRVKHTISDAAFQFRPGGKAEQTLGDLDQVVLGFDTRGYKEIKDFIKGQEAEVRKQYGNRYKFVYLDEVAPVPQTITDMRTAVNDLIMKHKDDGLLNVIEGVIYSRYTGLLLELKTAEYYFNQGYRILQGGRELFDEQGHYITELDVVVRSPQGVTYLVEAKSARVPLTQKDVMDGKILYKLDTYQKNRKRLEQKDILGGPLNVVFSVDVGVPAGDVSEDQRQDYIKRQTKLMTFLRSQEKILSAKYGFPVTFLFLYSTPGQDPATPDETRMGSSSDRRETGRSNGRRRHGRGRR